MTDIMSRKSVSRKKGYRMLHRMTAHWQLYIFLIPGMGHVAGGPGAQDYVYGLPACPKDEQHFGLLTLRAWCEEGAAPDRILPVHIEGDNVMAGFIPGVPVREVETLPFVREQ